jgi:ribonuclease HII
MNKKSVFEKYRKEKNASWNAQDIRPRMGHGLLTRPSVIAGIDDATKCPCIGSIFIAGVAADQDVISRWKEQGVKDSKLLTAKKRTTLSRIIKKTSGVFTIREIPPEKIDDKSLNLNEWEMAIVLDVIKCLHRKMDIGRVYIDNWEVSAHRFFQRLDKMAPRFQKKLASLTLVPEHQADETYTVVGAASILAKTASERQYERYKKEYGDFGSGSPADPKTRLFVWKHRKNPPPIIRTSWNTFRHLSSLRSFEEDILGKWKRHP